MNAPAGERGSAALYTRELLALAVSLADRPIDPSAPLSGEARSATCGSTIRFGCAVDAAGKIERPGLQVTACAVGQAAAALFVARAEGQNRRAIEDTRDALKQWLEGQGPMPDWPGLSVLDPARAYPARHGAIVLAWNAALAALPKETTAS